MKMRNVSAPFIYHNQNPDGKFIGDCTTRALSYALKKDYAAILEMQKSIDKKQWTCTWVWGNSLLRKNFNWVPIDLDNFRRMTACSAAKCLKSIQAPLILESNNHVAVAEAGSIVDTWDSRGKIVLQIWVPKKLKYKVTAMLEKTSR